MKGLLNSALKYGYRVSGPLGLVIALVLLLMPVFAPAPEEQVARSYGTNVYMEQGGAKLVVASGGSIEIQSGGALTMGNVTVSGPVRFGTASVVSGTLIAHGLGTTPTVVNLTASGYVSSTPVLLSSNATSMTVGFLNGQAPPTMTVHWLAGK